ncbi:uncharacterized protein RMCB_4576 [Mycolicibacterium brisbanense]|uniref:Uncharacterized protein n=1 Tax=Mycolicibacterium brisbanense TaxID=146020 RepID=A0A117I6S9_9MYCO|nr:uncharacterized protein RMCB_4576 [Mycolicibacterium brisbanense]
MASDPLTVKRADIAATASQLRLILGAIERGELEASATERTRLEGAAAALDALAGDAPAV